ncbi:MAG: hypothetical protein O3B42_04010 [Actinomycetota bacterium]|nr:hypothetical protein [Actinomycetota bacterium]
MTYRRLNLIWAAGCIESVAVASGFVDRFVGLRRQDLRGVMFAASSVHTFGFRHPISVFEVSSEGIVTDVRTLHPNRLHRRQTGEVIVEALPWCQAPSIGERLVALPSEPYDWNPRAVRNAHRKPWRYQRTVD